MLVNHYEVLHVTNSASTSIIRQSFRKLAQQTHPDKNHHDRDAIEKMKAINISYRVLKDPIARAAFDSQLRATLEYQQHKTPVPTSYSRSSGGTNTKQAETSCKFNRKLQNDVLTLLNTIIIVIIFVVDFNRFIGMHVSGFKLITILIFFLIILLGFPNKKINNYEKIISISGFLLIIFETLKWS